MKNLDYCRIMTSFDNYVLEALKVIDITYDFIYLLDSKENYKKNRKNHLINKWNILTIGKCITIQKK